jgi:hypothetical protein
MRLLDLLIFGAVVAVIVVIVAMIGLSFVRWVRAWQRVWELRAKNRPFHEAMKKTRVIFTASAREVARMDIALGPCFPLAGRKKPLSGRFAQEWPSTPAQIEALHASLVPDSLIGPWAAREDDPPGQLFTLSDEFVAALAHIDEERQAAASDEGRREVLASAAAAWHRSLNSDDPQAQDHLFLDVLSAAYVAARATRKNQNVYAWFGPGIELWGPERMARAVERIQKEAASRPSHDIQRP